MLWTNEFQQKAMTVGYGGSKRPGKALEKVCTLVESYHIPQKDRKGNRADDISLNAQGDEEPRFWLSLFPASYQLQTLREVI